MLNILNIILFENCKTVPEKCRHVVNRGPQIQLCNLRVFQIFF